MQQSRWKVSTRMNTDMVLDALEQALHDRGMPKNVIHHSDRGVQYLSIRYINQGGQFLNAIRGVIFTLPLTIR